MASDWPEASEAAMAAQDALDDAAWFGGELMKRDAENARLTALLAERDAEIKGLREAIDAVVFSLFYVGVGEARRYYVADGHGPAFSAAVRAALAARGGE